MSAANEESPTTERTQRLVATNPLPEGTPGSDLLVDLMTERAIFGCGIKENWEESGGWEYEDLRAIVACALGESYSTEQGRERMTVVEKRTLKSLMKEIRNYGAPPLNQGEDSGESFTPELYYAVLILGLFDRSNPVDATKTTESGAMKDEFAELMNVPVNKVKDRPFEHARKKVMERYQEHLERQRRRIAFRSRQMSEAGVVGGGEGLTDGQVFDLVLRQLANGDYPGLKLAPERQKEVNGFLMRLGIKPPGK